MGVLASPAKRDLARCQTAFLLLGAGLVHCVGPNRLYVEIARRLAARGAPVLRFDSAGIGDSTMTRPAAEPDIARLEEVGLALEELRRHHGASRFALIGLCSGAVTAFQAAVRDERVVAVAIANMDVGRFDSLSDARLTRRQVARYYARFALFQRASWVRLLTGRSNYANILRSTAQWLLSRDEEPSVSEFGVDQLLADLQILARRAVELLVVTSELDQSVDYVEALRGVIPAEVLDASGLRLQMVPGADHTFTLKQHQRKLLEPLDSWSARVLTDTGRTACRFSGSC